VAEDTLADALLMKASIRAHAGGLHAQGFPGAMMARANKAWEAGPIHVHIRTRNNTHARMHEGGRPRFSCA